MKKVTAAIIAGMVLAAMQSGSAQAYDAKKSCFSNQAGNSYVSICTSAAPVFDYRDRAAQKEKSHHNSYWHDYKDDRFHKVVYDARRDAYIVHHYHDDDRDYDKKRGHDKNRHHNNDRHKKQKGHYDPFGRWWSF